MIYPYLDSRIYHPQARGIMLRACCDVGDNGIAMMEKFEWWLGRFCSVLPARSNADRASMGGSRALSDKTLRRSAIIEERAKEFACEADGRWDLIRWGIYLDAMNAIGGSDDGGVLKTRSERNLLFPIPAQEINTNSSINNNNPGWN